MRADGKATHYIFQSTHSQGVRLLMWNRSGSIFLFQSTHSQGVRLNKSDYDKSSHTFQSTHSQGVRRILTSSQAQDFKISIHALTRSATATFGWLLFCLEISIHALTRSATCGWRTYRLWILKFQSTHSQGVRHHKDWLL
ncbi:Predicted protein [Lactobacillus helveticus H10]|nr:Predicted protein [Lactobacillus helveticus H10]